MTTAEQSSSRVKGSETPQANHWLAVSAVALGTFLLVSAEQLPIGLLTSVGSALSVSEGTAGLMVTVPSLVAAFAAPLVPMLVRGLDRRILLIGLMALMTVSNVASALAPNFGVLVASRVVVGVAIGGFWAVASGLAVRLVAPESVPKATAIIFGGVGAANVFGVPLGTLVGDFAGWRVAFASVSALALIALVALLVVLPPLVASQPIRPRLLAEQFRNPGVRIGIIATVFIVFGHFSAYTFVSPALQKLSGIDESYVGPLLFGFGLAGMIGNFVAGSALSRRVHRSVLAIALALAVAMPLFALLGRTTITGIILLIVWGLAYGGVSVGLQTWMIKAAPQAVEAASSLWVAVFNLSIGLGALVGGLIVDALSVQGVLWLGGACALVAALAIWSARSNESLR
ncbi:MULTISPECIES: MFS transporter [Kitasatospora]|uniref:Putative major facilitator superfamily transporter n=1 Tax=Kitasatospora setae (strain ATCC 33774 / DSM 43861 / JCM 3304 / KCC A-0304 / NBRC 14216 / KM-6054) TaxID=452652 RepID=E4N3Y1_KITSK|nr:MFS transporter [Kitasatospora setae]BAJ31612.1 putative major facilitator superfamily transporter [Kitasatospora setae KM-6054]